MDERENGMGTTGLELQIIVQPGTVTQNFEAFKEMVKNELETKYKNLDVSEKSLQDAKAARARLNKAKAALKESMRSAQRENDKPLMVPKAQAKKLEELLDEAIVTIDEQIKAIEGKRRDEKLKRANEVKDKVFSDASDEVKELAGKCRWIVLSEWGNVTYQMSKVEEDCTKARKKIESALKLLRGEFAPQMLDHFIRNGSVSDAQEEGLRLEAVKAENEKYIAPKPKAESTTAPPACSQTIEAPATVPASLQVPTKKERPEDFIESEKDKRVGSVDMRFTGMLYQIKWLRHLCNQEGITLQYIKKEN